MLENNIQLFTYTAANQFSATSSTSASTQSDVVARGGLEVGRIHRYQMTDGGGFTTTNNVHITTNVDVQRDPHATRRRDGSSCG